MPNTTLLQETLHHIEIHPDQWDQTCFASEGTGGCATSHCFAGWAVALAAPAAQFLFDRDDARTGTPFATSVLVEPAADTEWIFDAARDLLDIDDYTADILFDAANTLEDLRRMVANLCAGLFIDADGDDD